MIRGLNWYLVAVRSIRAAFEEKRIEQADAMHAVDEMGRLMGEDAELTERWGVL